MKFFFYGIFLDPDVRKQYGLTDEPVYATVRDFVTYGSRIVTAYKQEKSGLALTGITINVPDHKIRDIDELEYGYNRATVTTEQGDICQMYTGEDIV